MIADADSAADDVAFDALEGVVDDADAPGSAAAGARGVGGTILEGCAGGVAVDDAGAPGIEVAAIGRVLATIMVTSTKLVALFVSKRLTPKTG